jgi:hypothetical protein
MQAPPAEYRGPVARLSPGRFFEIASLHLANACAYVSFFSADAVHTDAKRTPTKAPAAITKPDVRIVVLRVNRQFIQNRYAKN